ncbi:MAG: hypothetical protein OHK0026_07570 [Rhodocyclaceae bacterium]
MKEILAGLLALALCLPVQAAQDLDALWAATLSDLEDRPVAMREFRGRPLVINFWARWCGPCREEIPELARTRARFRNEGVELLGIAIEDKAEPVRDFARAYDMDYPVLLAKEQGIALMRALGNPKAGLPYTLVIDRQGRLVHSRLGPMSPQQTEAAFRQALR